MESCNPVLHWNHVSSIFLQSTKKFELVLGTEGSQATLVGSVCVCVCMHDYRQWVEEKTDKWISNYNAGWLVLGSTQFLWGSTYWGCPGSGKKSWMKWHISWIQQVVVILAIITNIYWLLPCFSISPKVLNSFYFIWFFWHPWSRYNYYPHFTNEETETQLS